MNKPNVTTWLKGVRTFTTKHSPEILTGLGIAGMVTTTVLAVKATPKALKCIEEKKKEERTDELTIVETVQAAWKPYIPAAVTGGVSIACLIGASSVSARRNAALATAYQLSATALSDYKEKVVETIGEKKEKQIREEVAKKKVGENPVGKSEVYITSGGDTMFLDPISMRYFTSDLEKIRKTVNDLNYRLVCGMEEYISLSEFYDEIGLSHTSNSDDLGWNLGRDGQLEIDYHPVLADNGKPCLMLDFTVSPRYDYANLS